MSPIRSCELGYLFKAILADAIGRSLGLGAAQSVSLRFASTFGHRLRKVGKQHGKPEPECDLQIEAEVPLVSQNVFEQQQRSEYAAYFYDEHHGVPHHRRRIQLEQSIDDGAAHDLRVEQRALFSVFVRGHGSPD